MHYCGDMVVPGLSPLSVASTVLHLSLNLLTSLRVFLLHKASKEQVTVSTVDRRSLGDIASSVCMNPTPGFSFQWLAFKSPNRVGSVLA